MNKIQENAAHNNGEQNEQEEADEKEELPKDDRNNNVKRNKKWRWNIANHKHWLFDGVTVNVDIDMEVDIFRYCEC